MQKDERDERPEPPELNPEEVLNAKGHNSMKFVEISIKDIEQNENSRVIYKAIDLAELMASMKREGLLQPVGVRKLKSWKYDAVFGNRRILAAQKLGWKTIPANIMTDLEADTDRDLIGLVENLKRQNTSVAEDGRMFQSLIDRGLSKSEIASRLDVPVQRVEVALEVVSVVPEEYRKMIVYKNGGKRNSRGQQSFKTSIPASTAAAVINLRKQATLNRKQVRSIFKHITENNTSVAQIGKIAPLIKTGWTIAEALENVAGYQRLTLNCFIKESVIDGLEKKHGKTINQILLDHLIAEKSFHISKMEPQIKLRKQADRVRA